MKTLDVTRLICSAELSTVNEYLAYWTRIKPKDGWEALQRWLFASLSIKATWQKNRDAYLLLKDKPWDTEKELRALLLESRVGLVERRTKTILQMYERYESAPEYFFPVIPDYAPIHIWQGIRNRYVKELYGFGIAKASFSLEMCYPRQCKVVCADTHILQMYGVSDGHYQRMYPALERHWVSNCQRRNNPSPMVRHILWDRIQGKENTRYWSDVFEKEVLCPAL